MALRDQIEGMHGGILALLGVVVLCPDALLIRFIEADDFTTAFWRLGFLTIALLMLALWQGIKGGEGIIQSIMPDRYETLTGLFYGGTCAFFILSVRNTDAANTLVIIAATPLLAGVIGVLVFKRRQPMRTWIASIVVFVALLSLISAGFGGENALGDILALGTACCMAGFFNVIGAKPHMNEVRGMLVGAFLSTLVMVPGAQPLAVQGMDWVWLLALGFWVLPVSFLLISAASRKIPAAEVSLIMLNEAILGSFLVWLFIDEVPSQTTFLSGTVVIVTLVVHSLIGMRAARRRRAAV
ncbi:DMT family transporter [Thalassospira sp. MA62]|nr:DMT family transporter [Thalassospira sp. MA62]